MPTQQSTYGSTTTPFVEGMVANSEKSNIITRVVQGSTPIGFGKVCVQGTAENQVKPSEASLVFRGISVLDPTQLQANYPQYANISIITKGVVVVNASVIVAAGQPVYYVPATGLFTNISNSSANTLIPGAMWDSTTTAINQLAKVRLG